MTPIEFMRKPEVRWFIIGMVVTSGALFAGVSMQRAGLDAVLDSTQKYVGTYGALLGFVIGATAVAYTSHAIAKVYKDGAEHRAKLSEMQSQIMRAQMENTLVQDENAQRWLEDTGALSRRIVEEINKKLEGGVNSPMAVGGAMRNFVSPILNLETVFGERIGHFDAEKELLADALLKIVTTRAEFLITECDKNVIVIVDSGTTLFAFFERIGMYMAQRRMQEFRNDDNKWWGHSFRIVTNSIAGIESFIINARMSRDGRYSETACNSELVPGTPLAVYSAAVGPLACEHIDGLKDKKTRDVPSRAELVEPQRDVHVIAITTGNYVLLTPEGRPVPLARGEGHKDFKEKICGEVADEIFVVGPLAKFITMNANMDAQKFNDILQYRDDHWSVDHWPYDEVKIKDDKLVRVLTTYRPSVNYILSGHAASVRAYLQHNDGVSQLEISELDDREFRENLRAKTLDGLPNLMIDFASLPEDADQQRLVEMPHANVRNPRVRKVLYGVNN